MESSKGKIQFNNNESLKIKGVAIILMVLLHAVYHAPKGVVVTYAFLPQNIVLNVAGMGKICVSMFAFVSGYGLWKSYERRKTSCNKWTIRQLFKLFSKFWFVWIITAVACEIVSGRSREVYFKDGIITGIKNIIIEMLGLAKLFHTPSLTSVYWYIGAAVFFVLCIPFLYYMKQNLVAVVFIIILLPRILAVGDNGFLGTMNPGSFLFVFILGVMASEHELIERWTGTFCFRGGKIIKFILEVILLFICYKIYYILPLQSYWEIHWGVIPFVIIVFCVEFINQIPVICNMLSFLGKHSMNIYLVHSMLKNMYLKEWLYSLHNWFLILIALLAVSIVISYVIEGLKKLLKFDKFVDFILEKVK
ncbi:MAG: acyltransferase [Bacteroides sp.]|nr:acyltransferase [Bacteroides sp.]